MVSSDRILRVCSVCQLVEIEENLLLPTTDQKVKELVDKKYLLSHGILSRQCAKDFYKEDFAEIEDFYVPGLSEDGKRIYENCQR